MVRRFVVALVIAVVVSANGVISQSSVRADTQGCVTKREFRQAQRDTGIRRVHRIFDTRGWFIDGGAGGFVRGYKFCPQARRLAGARSFKIIYHANVKDLKVVWVRVWLKYCGPTYAARRACF